MSLAGNLPGPQTNCVEVIMVRSTDGVHGLRRGHFASRRCSPYNRSRPSCSHRIPPAQLDAGRASVEIPEKPWSLLPRQGCLSRTNAQSAQNRGGMERVIKNGGAFALERFDRVRANEAGAAGDQDPHCLSNCCKGFPPENHLTNGGSDLFVEGSHSVTLPSPLTTRGEDKGEISQPQKISPL